MSSRIDRIKWRKENFYSGTNSPMDIGDAIGSTYSLGLRLTYDEVLDFIMKPTFEEEEFLEKRNLTFGEKRQFIEIINKYIDYSTPPNII